MQSGECPQSVCPELDGRNPPDSGVESPCAVALRQSRLGVSRVEGALKTSIRSYIEPCDPSTRETPPQRDGWIYEINAEMPR